MIIKIDENGCTSADFEDRIKFHINRQNGFKLKDPYEYYSISVDTDKNEAVATRKEKTGKRLLKKIVIVLPIMDYMPSPNWLNSAKKEGMMACEKRAACGNLRSFLNDLSPDLKKEALEILKHP